MEADRGCKPEASLRRHERWKSVACCLACAAALLLVASDEGDEHQVEELEICAALIRLHVETIRVDHTVIRTVRERDLRIADVSEERAWSDYRFRKGDLPRLFNVLRFPDVWECRNRSRFAGETAFLLMLRRLRYAKARLSVVLCSPALYS